MTIAPNELSELIKAHLQAQSPGASADDIEVQVLDKTGMSDHYIVYVCWAGFSAMPAMARHRTVYAAVTPALQSGALHAIEIKTAVPQPA